MHVALQLLILPQQLRDAVTQLVVERTLLVFQRVFLLQRRDALALRFKTDERCTNMGVTLRGEL